MPAAYVAAAASVASAANSIASSGDSANTLSGAAGNSTALQQQIYGQTTQNLAPFLNAGTGAIPTLESLLGLNPGGVGAPNATALRASPGYQAMLNGGTDAINNHASATGGVRGGNTLKSLMQYGQGLADNTYQQYFSNVAGLAGTGQNAAVSQGEFGGAFGAAAGQNALLSGVAQASGQTQQGNGISALLGQLFGGGGGGGGAFGTAANGIANYFNSGPGVPASITNAPTDAGSYIPYNLS